MKRYRITLDVVVAAASRKCAEKLETRMLDAVADDLVDSVSRVEKEQE